jgi:hypothetical protein
MVGISTVFRINTKKRRLLILSLALIIIQVNAQHDEEKLGAKASISDTSITLINEDTLVLPSFYSFNLPVKILTGCEVSALTLGLYYDHELLEIDTVIVNKEFFGQYNNITDSIFLIVWSSINPVTLSDDDTLFSLQMRSLDLSLLEGITRFTLKSSSEFAGPDAIEIDSVILDASAIQYRKPIPPDTNSGFSIKIWPNPFSEYTTIEFSLEMESQIMLTLNTPEGLKIREWDEKTYPVGTHQVRIYGSDYSKGIYLLKFEMQNPEGEGKKVIKIISIW